MILPMWSSLGASSKWSTPAAAREALGGGGAGPALDDIGLIVFTSGSTGRPKAAMMSWRGLNAAAQGLNSMLQCRAGEQLVSYLPLCHMAEQMFSIHIPIAVGASVNFAESLRTVQEDLRELAPHVFFGVPRIWEKFHAAIQTKLREAGGIRMAALPAGRCAHCTVKRIGHDRPGACPSARCTRCATC